MDFVLLAKLVDGPVGNEFVVHFSAGHVLAIECSPCKRVSVFVVLAKVTANLRTVLGNG